jgi:2-polyprenyl-3-methyl-5-hydroxy-6-metoxy-1,4-benzoquinol methylase
VAEQYSETRKKKLWPILASFLEEVKSGDKVLDVGCGSGKILQGLEEKDINYLGVDPSEKLLEKAREEWGEDDKRKFIYGDILKLGEIDGLDFDFVFCIAVLQHIPSQKLRVQALKQLKNKVKEDGKIVVSNWNMWSKKFAKKKFRYLVFKFWLLKLFGKNKMDFGDILFDWKNPNGHSVSKRYYHAFTAWELKRICRKAGLKIEEITKDEFNYYLILRKG